MRNAMKSILNPDQYEKWKKIEKQKERKKRKHSKMKKEKKIVHFLFANLSSKS